MGQSNNTAGYRQFLTQYQLEAKNYDLNLTFLTHRQTHQHYLLRELTFTDPKEFEATRKLLQSRAMHHHRSATSLVRVESQQQESLCSRVFRLYGLWQHSSVTLVEEINNRGLERRPFDHRQLADLLRAITGGLMHYCALGTGYEGLTTRSVLVGWNSFKLSDPLMLPPMRNLQTVHSNRNIKNIYLSPEECRAVQQQWQGQKWKQSDGVFTAGMIALQSATLQRQDKCYLEQTSKINWNAIKQNLDKIAEKYGYQIKDVIAEMLQQDTNKRIQLRQLWTKIQKISIPSERKSEAKEHREIRTPSSYERKPLPLGGLTASRVNNDSKSPPFFSAHKLKLSQIDSQHSPQRLVQTTYPRLNPPIDSTKNTAQQRPLPLLEMKTINTNTEIQQPLPLFSFERELSTNPPQKAIENPLPHNDTHTSDSSESIKFKKYEHHTPTNPQARYFVEEFKLGSRYEGFKVGGYRQGWGKFRFQDGGFYEGQWHNNKMHGYGRLFYLSGKLAYEGNWSEDEFNGIGKLYNESYSSLRSAFDFNNLAEVEEYWVYYEGQFKRDVKWGEGVLRLSNGEYYKGHFQNDQISGEGEYFALGGRRVLGRWQRGRLSAIHSVLQAQ